MLPKLTLILYSDEFQPKKQLPKITVTNSNPLPVIQAGLERVQWSAAVAAAAAVEAVMFVFYFLSVPMAVFETYYQAVPALPLNSFGVVQLLFSSKRIQTKIVSYTFCITHFKIFFSKTNRNNVTL